MDAIDLALYTMHEKIRRDTNDEGMVCPRCNVRYCTPRAHKNTKIGSTIKEHWDLHLEKCSGYAESSMEGK